MDSDSMPAATAQTPPILVTLQLMPTSFWIAAMVLAIGLVWAWGQRSRGLGYPVMAVLGTIGAWYFADAFYNNYVVYSVEFPPDVRSESWWQVGIFLGSFLILAPMVHGWINGRLLHHTSCTVHMTRTGIQRIPPQVQIDLKMLLWGCFATWTALSVIAFLRLYDGEFLYYVCPYFGHRADPWVRGRLGTGYDSLLSVAGYLQLVTAAMFGILAALLKNPGLRFVALLGMLVTWPYFIFDRTRNTILSTVVPAILAWVFIRLRIHIVFKIIILLALFAVISAWFGYVLSYRSEDESIATAFATEGFNPEKNMDVHHAGLNMFEELCWANYFIDNGTWKVDPGANYFSELVNFIPRTLWPDKPTIALDYAVMRGQSYEEGQAGVGATLSTGMIGQGVLNFGPYIGPVFAAFLMTIWTAVLARLDLTGFRLGRLPLYSMGLILTFNLGRDITLLTLYTFVFAAMVVWLLDRRNRRAPMAAHVPAAGTPPATRPHMAISPR